MVWPVVHLGGLLFQGFEGGLKERVRKPPAADGRTIDFENRGDVADRVTGGEQIDGRFL